MPSTAKRNSPERTTLPPLADPDEIRLLCLLPGVFGERIICTTTHLKLSENFHTKPPASLPLCNRSVDVHRPETAHHRPQYEALSYVWGPTEMKSISLNGQSCDVRENLFDALVNLRSENQQRTLWVDAICINQDDMKERNHQVSRMESIYSQAEKVAWLGLSDEFTVEALGFLQSFDPEIESLTGFIFKNELADTEEGCRILEGVRSISLRPYWTRLWIIQELQLASEAYVQCGKDCVPWELFKGFVADLEFEDSEYPVVSGRKLRENGQEENVSPMSNLMWQSMDKSPSARARQYLSLL